MNRESAPRVFIDGSSGTTGLELHERLRSLIERGKLGLVQAGGNPRDQETRRKAFSESDLAVLCLPDNAARDSIEIAGSLGADKPKILDTSTAHRTRDDWVYGFPELRHEQPELIKNADTVSNPGCYATGAIALLYPLVRSGILPTDYPVTINAVSGYSGGGKKMIEIYEKGDAPGLELYGLGLEHKHIPEIQKHSGLIKPPLFIPSVGKFYRGMLVCIPLNFSESDNKLCFKDIAGTLSSHYVDSDVVSVFAHSPEEDFRLNPQELSGTDKINLHVFQGKKYNQALLAASFDNLGKGAAGAAMQNIRLMLDIKN